MAAPLIVRLVMDAAGYLKTVDTAVASNTKLEESSLSVGEAMQVSATRSVQASLRATESLQAQVVAYRELATAAGQSAAVRERANLLADKTQSRLNYALGATSVAQASASKAAQTGERDLGKFTRGALAGSGAASSLGRSLAFASTGFIAIAGSSTIIAASIKEALSLAKTQRQVEAQLKTGGKSWDQYGARINAADLRLSHISGFTNQELLQGFGYLVRENNNVGESLKLTSEAADVARGRNISLASAAIALAKAQGGSVTALRRLGIVVPKGVEGLQALAFVQQKFAGQAAAGATVSDKFHASLVDTEETIGNVLLPTFTRLTTEITDWLAKMTDTGRLQRDLNEALTVGGTAFHVIGAAIGVVDKVTGSFGNTLKILFEVYLGREIFKAAVGVKALAASWVEVGAAATGAAGAQERAVAAGGAAGAEGAAAGAGAGGRAALGGLTTANIAAIAAIVATVVINTSTYKRLQSDASGALGHFGFLSDNLTKVFGPVAKRLRDQQTYIQSLLGIPQGLNPPPFTGSAARYGGSAVPSAFQVPGFGRRSPSGPGALFGGVTPLAVYSKYTQTISEQLAAAQAALTKTTRDDVAVAKAIIARIKRLINQGHLSGASLVQALQDEATQQGVLNSARQAAAQQAAKIAAAKQAAASSYSTPIDLQLAEARAQLTASNADDVRVEKQILAAARGAAASAGKNKQGQLAALQVELQAKQALESLQQQTSTSFTQPARLQLALAKAQATGGDQTAVLLKMKSALERALKAAKGNIQKQTDIYNQIAAINQQLGSDANTAFGQYKQASLAAETAGLGLTHAQRKALEARLSQRGPHGTTPGSGTGAYGYTIGRSGRPIHVHTQINLDGQKVASNTTKHQQKRRRRNSAQRRGPNAGGTG